MIASANEKIRATVQKGLGYFGYSLKKEFYPDIEKEFFPLNALSEPCTMTGFESRYTMFKAATHAVTALEGDIVECGVWRGGISMIVASVLKTHNSDKKIYMYDTYAGMSEPIDKDVRFDGADATSKWNERKKDDGTNAWDFATLDEVKNNMAKIGYEHVEYVQGKVEDTIPATIPEKIALLRLDTDWYESTKHELEYLFPLLVPGGILVLDDYGHWVGARTAVDEYFAKHNIKMLLNRIDHGARIGIKV